MGDIAFEIEKFVELNKQVNVDIDKQVNANVNNPDQLATAEADAEAFGSNALAEVDAYTVVTEPNGEVPQPPVPVPGQIDVLGNTVDFIVGSAIEDNTAATLGLDFTNETPDAVPPLAPDVDDINGFGKLDFLSSPPPDTPDVPIPDPLFSISSAGGGNVSFDRTATPVDEVPAGILAAEYALTEDMIISFGDRGPIDLNGDGVANTGELQLIVPAGTLFGAEFTGESPPAGPIEFEFVTFVDPDDDGLINRAYWTHTGETNTQPVDIPNSEIPAGAYEVPVDGFVFEAQSLNNGVGIGDYAIEARGVFYDFVPPIPGDGGTAFAYAESTSALDLNATGLG